MEVTGKGKARRASVRDGDNPLSKWQTRKTALSIADDGEFVESNTHSARTRARKSVR